MEIQNSKQILDYLNDFSYENDSEIKELIHLIEKSRFELSQKSVSMVKLSHYRILSSNSLKKKEGLEGWDKANKYIFQEIANVSKINKEHAVKINQFLHSNAESDFRKSDIFSAQWKYLEYSYLDQAWNEFSKNILSRPHSILRSCEIYIWMVTMHPFSNGNGRTARLLSDWSLLEQSYLPLCFDSSVSSHVAAVIGDKSRNKKDSIKKTLSAILRAYEISLN